MYKNLEEILRNNCDLIDWRPTQNQLSNIKKDLEASLLTGKSITKSECQRIVVKHCGSTKMFMMKGADNSDLNTLLAMAIASIKQDK